MRVWYPIPPLCLDGPRLTGVHNEIHAINNIILDPEKGYQHHPEVNRWRGFLPALAAYHDLVVQESWRRGWKMGTNHKTPLFHDGPVVWPEFIEPIEVMRAKLAAKWAAKLAA